MSALTGFFDTLNPLLSLLGRSLMALLGLLLILWGAGALWYQLPLPTPWRLAAMAVWLAWVLGLGLWLAPQQRWLALCLLWALSLGAMLLWWSQIEPSNDRLWADDVAQQLHWQRQGQQLTLNNVRNFEWRSDNDYTPRWETRHYDLDTLRTVDTAMSYWMGPAIAHTLVSFGFADGRQLVFSIEIRKKRGEQFSAVAGFFKHDEATLVAADERDILRVRTNVRDEDVYLYRVAMAPEAQQALLLSYLEQAQALREQAMFYNTLTTNCTTVVYEMVRRIVPGLPLDWRLLASGYLPAYLQELGVLTPGYSLAQLRSAARITDRARQTPPDLDERSFSRAIRQGSLAITPEASHD